MTEYDLGKVVGDDGADGNGIASISKTGTSGLVDTYTITYDDGDSDTFTVTNGADGQTGATGNGIASVTKTGTSGLVDTYTILFTNGDSTTFTVTNGSDASVTIVTSFSGTTSDSKVPSEKLTKTSLDDKVDKVTGKGLSTNDFTASYKSTMDSLKTVATSGSYNDLSNKPSIPSKVSDLTNDTGFITSSSLPTKTSDLTNDSGYITSSSLPTKTSDLQNDGDGTNAFLTQHQSLSGYLQTSDIGASSSTSSSKIVACNDTRLSDARTPTAHNHDDRYYTETEIDTSLSGKVNTSDVANNLTTTASGKVLDARQGKALADLIGDAITYINQ